MPTPQVILIFSFELGKLKKNVKYDKLYNLKFDLFYYNTINYDSFAQNQNQDISTI